MAQRRSPLSSRTSRAALPASDAPIWEVISPGVRLGYRPGRGTQRRGGSWLAATRHPDGRRLQTKLGKADDVAASDGGAILSHEEAKERARAWVRKVTVADRATGGALTVDGILDRYLEAREAEGMKSVVDARSRAKTHIRPHLGKLTAAELTVERLRRWRDGLVKAPKRVRTAKLAKKPNTRDVDMNDPEAVRRRRDTANRTLTTLKAALNWAHEHRLIDDDTAWRLVKPFRGTTAARIRFLDAEEQRRLLDNSAGALRDLISAALVTGARFGELARLQVRDFDKANASVFIAESKSGKPRHVPLPPGGAALFGRLTEGRASDAALLERVAGAAWKAATYQRPFREAVAAAGLGTVTLHELRHSYASAMVRAGAPLIVVAQALGHADTRMVDKHYAHLAPSFIAETIRKFAPDITEAR